ncbi:MAG: hypothetical protein L6435_14065 [Anaerolineae bacterium]|nr:hypothetical protein [Anaerolineae bacterium]
MLSLLGKGGRTGLKEPVLGLFPPLCVFFARGRVRRALQGEGGGLLADRYPLTPA